MADHESSLPMGVPPGGDDRMDTDRADERERDYRRDEEPRRDDRDRDRDGDRERSHYDRRDDRKNSPPPRPRNAPVAEENSCVGIFGLSIRTREADLEDEFGKCGRVDNVVIVYDQRTERSRGFGFITMDSVESARKAIDRISGMDLHGRRVRVDFSSTTRAHKPTPGEYRGRKTDDWGYRGSYSDRGGGYGGGYDRYDDRDRRPPPPRRDDRDDYYRRRSPSPRRYRDDRDDRDRRASPPRRRRSLSRSRSPPRRRSISPRRD